MIGADEWSWWPDLLGRDNAGCGDFCCPGGDFCLPVSGCGNFYVSEVIFLFFGGEFCLMAVIFC